MNASLIGGFISGFIVGAIVAGYFLGKWTAIMVRKRWDRLLEESPQFYEGAYSAWIDCIKLVDEARRPEDLLTELGLHAQAEKDRVAKLLEYKVERAEALGQQDAIQEITGEGK